MKKVPSLFYAESQTPGGQHDIRQGTSRESPTRLNRKVR